MSSLPPRDTTPATEPSDGFVVSNVSPDAAGTHSPLTNSLYSRMAYSVSRSSPLPSGPEGGWERIQQPGSSMFPQQLRIVRTLRHSFLAVRRTFFKNGRSLTFQFSRA